MPSLVPSVSLITTASLLLDMAGKLMHAVQYSSYGGGAAGLKVDCFLTKFPLFVSVIGCPFSLMNI